MSTGPYVPSPDVMRKFIDLMIKSYEELIEKLKELRKQLDPPPDPEPIIVEGDGPVDNLDPYGTRPS
jgi:hypothetical protein